MQNDKLAAVGQLHIQLTGVTNLGSGFECRQRVLWQPSLEVVQATMGDRG